jgi:hypothetical protein
MSSRGGRVGGGAKGYSKRSNPTRKLSAAHVEKLKIKEEALKKKKEVILMLVFFGLYLI